MIGSLVGNYIAGAIAKLIGYSKAISLVLALYCIAMWMCFKQERSYHDTLVWFTIIGACQGAFGLFTMCLPPLFPTLLRTTGSGFCYNIGRIAAAAGTVVFGILAQTHDYASALFYTGFLFLPAAALALVVAFLLLFLRGARRPGAEAPPSSAPVVELSPPERPPSSGPESALASDGPKALIPLDSSIPGAATLAWSFACIIDTCGLRATPADRDR